MKNLYSFYAKYKQDDGFDIIPPSVEIDLTNHCNQACYYCNVEHYMEEFPNKSTFDDYIKLIDRLKAWPEMRRDLRGAVHTITFVGGGEPTVFKGYEKIIEHALNQGFDVSLITNGVNLDKLLSIGEENIKKLSWVGVDVDAGSEKLYNTIRKPKSNNNFQKVKENIRALTKIGANVDMKVLLVEENNNKEAINDIFNFALQTKVRMVYFRLASIDGSTTFIDDDIRKHIGALSDETEVLHRLNTTRAIKRTYEKCHALFFLPIFSADGSMYTCCEHRGTSVFNLCNWLQDDFERIWCGQKHKNMYCSVDVTKCPPCRPNQHNIELQKLIDNPNLREDLFF